jgi:ribose transport system ATP-binding protein
MPVEMTRSWPGGAPQRPPLRVVLGRDLPHWARLGLTTVALVAVGGLIAPTTVTAAAVLSMLPFIAILALASIGQHLVMNQRGFDLSVAGAMSLGAVLITAVPGPGASPLATVGFTIMTLVAGAACGAVNGLAVALVRIPSLVATLGVNALLVAIAIGISGGSPHMVPASLGALAQGHAGPIPNTMIVLVLITGLTALALNRTPAGRRYMAVGASPAAARVIGVPVSLTIVMTYMLAGLCYATAAIMLAGVVQSPSVTTGNPYVLSTVAAVAVGGNATFDRRTSIVATVIGSVLLTYLGNLVVSLGFDKAVQYIVQALVIIVSAGLPGVAQFAGFAGRRRTPGATAAIPQARAQADLTPPAAPALELIDIRKSFGPVVALKAVSLSILPGEVHAIVGENGAGKSTLISIAAGTLVADSGALISDGTEIVAPTAATMRDRGLSVAYQHPALAPDLTVLENIQLFMDKAGNRLDRAEAEALITLVALPHLRMEVHRRVADLSIAQRHVVEIARALAISPRILFLDEPTEPFQKDDVGRLFDLIADLKARGTAIVYVSHRLHEVMAIADRISILRDGELIDSRRRGDITNREIVTLIAGRPLAQVFPPKGAAAGAPVLEVRGLSGPGYSNVGLVARRGEIVGLTGVEGQGQREVLRAIAGAERHDRGDVYVGGVLVEPGPAGARRAGIGFIPDDRHAEGLFLSLSIRENIGFTALSASTRGGVIDLGRERQVATKAAADYEIKAPSIETPVSALSGGNQQKVLFGRELLTTPAVLLVDEPTRGIDIGTRSEIYRRLRQIAEGGVGVVISSSDGTEIEGLCDRVVIFGRGSVVRELAGAEVIDETITEANMTGTTLREAETRSAGRRSLVRTLLASDHFPGATLAVLALALAIGTNLINPYFLTAFSIGNILTLTAMLGLVSAGQLCAVLVGGIDLAVGPLAGLGVVLASFLLGPDESTMSLALGCAGIVLFCAIFGLLQGVLIVGLRMPAVVVTLASFIGLQGVSLILRPNAGGMIDGALSDLLTIDLGGIPAGMALTVLVTVLLQWRLSRGRFGRQIRAIGSHAASAVKLGVVRGRTVVLAFCLSGLLTGLGAVMLAAQVGIGSPVTGIDFTLMSITAVVLGGASIAGGRGSFLGTLVGCVLLQLMLSAATFLQAGPAWQYVLIGVATIVAAALFSLARRRSDRS